MRNTGHVRWADTDASGRIHFTAPFRWVEDVEHAFYRSSDPDVDLRAFPRRAVSSTYERPLSAGEVFEVELLADRLGTTSIGYRWWVRRGGEVCIEGSHTVVHLSSEGKPTPLPDALRRALELHPTPAA